MSISHFQRSRKRGTVSPGNLSQNSFHKGIYASITDIGSKPLLVFGSYFSDLSASSIRASSWLFLQIFVLLGLITSHALPNWTSLATKAMCLIREPAVKFRQCYQNPVLFLETCFLSVDSLWGQAAAGMHPTNFTMSKKRNYFSNCSNRSSRTDSHCLRLAWLGYVE